MIKVINLSTEVELFFDRDLDAVTAVIAAYAQQELRDYGWESYHRRYASLVKYGNKTIACGDWVTLKTGEH